MLGAVLRAAAVDAEIRGDATITEISYDSREVSSGDLFCCIPGEHLDRHDFAADAAAAGASALLVERFVDVDLPQARVGRIRDVLGVIADSFYGHPSQQVPVAGVTGTNGKTTVTYLVGAIAEAAGKTPGTIGTISARFAGLEEPAARTTPEAVDVQRLFRRMVDAGVDVIAMEATSDGLVAGRLRGTSFATAGFTNLTQDHLNTHGTMDAYFEAKALLFDGSYTSRAVINIDDPYGRRLVGKPVDVTTYGFDDGDIRCTSIELRADGTRASVTTPSGDVDLVTPLVGRYNVANCMCAIGLALEIEIDLDAIVSGIASLDRVPGRLDSVQSGQPFLALVDYAHTPDALEQALRACRELAGEGRVIAVFGCGGDRDKAKRPQMGEVATRLADLTIVTSDNPRSEDPDAILAEILTGAERGGGAYRAVVDRREAIGEALNEAREGDVVLVAGKGHEQGQYFADRTVPFDDREVVRDVLKELAWTA